jgi:hypothetical protein
MPGGRKNVTRRHGAGNSPASTETYAERCERNEREAMEAEERRVARLQAEERRLKREQDRVMRARAELRTAPPRSWGWDPAAGAMNMPPPALHVPGRYRDDLWRDSLRAPK